jgi:hypothetical protein
MLSMLVLGLLALLLPASAQAHETEKLERPTLTVSSSSSVSASPDTAFISLGMESAGKSLAEAQRQNHAVMQKVLDRLRELKIEKERIQTTAFTVAPQYRSPSKRNPEGAVTPPEIVGYTVSNTVSVEVRDPEKVAAVIDESSAAGANHFHGLQWALKDEQQHRLAALQTAATKAREKAAALSRLLNVKLVRLLNAAEGGHVVRPAPYMGRAMATMEAAADAPISSGELKVEATVTLIYEIDRE